MPALNAVPAPPSESAVLNKAHSLYNKLIHAVRGGEPLGYRTNPLTGLTDTLTGRSGTWNLAPTTATQFGQSLVGPYAGFLPTYTMVWPGPPSSVSVAAGCSVFGLLRPRAVATSVTIPYGMPQAFFGGSSSGIGFMTGDSSNAACHLSNGTGTSNFIFLGAGTIPVGEWKTWAATWRTGDLLRLYLNGELVGSNTTAITPSTVANFYCGDGSPQTQMDIAVACSWNRQITASEILQLHSDPYTLWRNTYRPVYKTSSKLLQSSYFLAF